MKSILAIVPFVMLTSFAHAEKAGENFKAKISLLQEQIVQGEPLVLKYSFQNISGQHSSFTHHSDAREWMTLKITSSEGKSINLAQDFRPAPGTNYGYGGTALTLLDSDSRIEGKIVLGQWTRFRYPGKYQIEVRLTPFPSSRGTKQKEVFIEKFQVTVKPVSVYRLQRLAEKYLKQIRKTGGEEQIIALQCLFSLPDFSARNQWEDLVSNETDEIVLQEIGEQLNRIGEGSAFNLLRVLDQKRQEKLDKDPHYLQLRQEAEEADRKEREKDASP